MRHVIFCTLHPTHLTSHLTPYTLHLTPYTSHLTPHTLHLRLHTSHLTPHTSLLTPHSSHLTSETSYLPLHTLLITRHTPLLTPQHSRHSYSKEGVGHRIAAPRQNSGKGIAIIVESSVISELKFVCFAHINIVFGDSSQDVEASSWLDIRRCVRYTHILCLGNS